MVDFRKIESSSPPAWCNHAAVYADVTPRHKLSGTRYTPMSKAGSSRLRKVLFFPAMSAMTHNKLCKTFAARLEEKGKKRIVILGGVMTKLLHLIFGILRSGKPFDPIIKARSQWYK